MEIWSSLAKFLQSTAQSFCRIVALQANWKTVFAHIEWLERHNMLCMNLIAYECLWSISVHQLGMLFYNASRVHGVFPWQGHLYWTLHPKDWPFQTKATWHRWLSAVRIARLWRCTIQTLHSRGGACLWPFAFSKAFWGFAISFLASLELSCFKLHRGRATRHSSVLLLRSQPFLVQGSIQQLWLLGCSRKVTSSLDILNYLNSTSISTHVNCIVAGASVFFFPTDLICWVFSNMPGHRDAICIRWQCPGLSQTWPVSVCYSSNFFVTQQVCCV